MTQEIVIRARSLFQQGDFQAACAALDGVLQDNTQAPARDILHIRAHLALAMKQPDAAAAFLDRLLVLYPDDAQGWDDRGVLYQTKHEFMAAAECHLKAAEKAGAQTGPLLNLAIALTHLGQKASAQKLYHDILLLDPNHARAHLNLGVLADEAGHIDQAAQFFERAKALGEKSFELSMGLANVARQREQLRDAEKYYHEALEFSPNHPAATFMLSVVKGETVATPPSGYIATLFDGYAGHFEQSLLQTLAYQAPQTLYALLREPLTQLHAEQGALTSVDLGAGTGLLGQLLRPHVTDSIAVDLSAKMLEQARAQKIYDRIIVDDLVHALAAMPAHAVHLATAADVVIYVGDLAPLFKALQHAVQDKGLVALTTEMALPDETTAFALRKTGRYSHAYLYVVEQANAQGFSLIAHQNAPLRLNKNEQLMGDYFVFKKTGLTG